MKIRINKYLAQCGIGSRRKNDEYIQKGLVTVNGIKAKVGMDIDTEKDIVLYKDTSLYPVSNNEYYALNKPLNILSTAKDEFHRKNVVSMVKSTHRLYPIGRLDKDSTGLILLTDDGDLALKLTHPRYHLPKVYDVVTNEPISDRQLTILSEGIVIQDKTTLPAIVKRKGKNSFTITLYQGMKRQIREMCAAIGLSVTVLNRIAIGPIKLEDLKPGQYRPLTQSEVDDLKRI